MPPANFNINRSHRQSVASCDWCGSAAPTAIMRRSRSGSTCGNCLFQHSLPGNASKNRREANTSETSGGPTISLTSSVRSVSSKSAIPVRERSCNCSFCWCSPTKLIIRRKWARPNSRSTDEIIRVAHNISGKRSFIHEANSSGSSSIGDDS